MFHATWLMRPLAVHACKEVVSDRGLCSLRKKNVTSVSGMGRERFKVHSSCGVCYPKLLLA